MESRERCITCLERLASELTKRGFSANVTVTGNRPHLQVINPDSPTLSERVYCQTAADDSWCLWWPWRQPIGCIDDLELVAGKIMTVLRSVQGTS
jgi:hypothetical protein